jgi:hypothetical protein
MFVKPLSVGDEKNLSVRWKKKKTFFSKCFEKKWMIKKFNLRKCDADITISRRDFFVCFCKNFGLIQEEKKQSNLYPLMVDMQWPLWKERNFDLRIASLHILMPWWLCCEKERFSIWRLLINTSFMAWSPCSDVTRKKRNDHCLKNFKVVRIR